jgi:hypothetical protein
LHFSSIHSNVAHFYNQFKTTGFTPTHFLKIKVDKRIQIDDLNLVIILQKINSVTERVLSDICNVNL